MEYLKAKEIIKRDAKGFTPNWDNHKQWKYYGNWDCSGDKILIYSNYYIKHNNIFFEREKDVEDSFKKHPEEWKTYLTYEQ